MCVWGGGGGGEGGVKGRVEGIVCNGIKYNNRLQSSFQLNMSSKVFRSYRPCFRKQKAK